MAKTGSDSKKPDSSRKSRPPGQTYTIDELAAFTSVPSRTIRFYQSKGVVAPPKREGRVAYYDPSHVDQLKRVGELKDKGLTIRAIRDLVTRIDRGELLYSDWLGFEEQVETPWIDDKANVMQTSDIEKRVGTERKGIVAALEKMGVIEKRGVAWFVPSMARFNLVLQLDKAGLDLDAASQAGDILERHVSRAAKELVEFFTKQFEAGFGHNQGAGDVVKTLSTLKSLGLSAITLTFAHAVQDELRRAIQSGKATIGLKKK